MVDQRFVGNTGGGFDALQEVCAIGDEWNARDLVSCKAVRLVGYVIDRCS